MENDDGTRGVDSVDGDGGDRTSPRKAVVGEREVKSAARGRERDAKTGQLTSGPSRTKNPWRYRYSINVSPSAYISLLRVQLLLREMFVPWDVSGSTSIEFLVAVLRAYHDGERLDMTKWQPETKRMRPRIKPNPNAPKGIQAVAKAEQMGIDYLRERIEDLENDFAIVREKRPHGKIPRIKDQRPKQG
jgi:hypothetical protein